MTPSDQAVFLLDVDAIADPLRFDLPALLHAGQGGSTASEPTVGERP